MKFEPVHSCIRVGNLEKSIEFYTKALNLKVVKEMDMPEKKFTNIYVANEKKDFQIELTYNYGVDNYELGNGYSHIAFYVEDIKEAHRKHKELGYEVTDIYSMSEKSRKLYFVTDPDGYKIELLEKYK